mmetsp:Transcript_48599/g.43580  ORF Transcript_48599/g.43580 Transcript_48599/m.43580 type:complete len:298 (-) Transcript_48599:32-925(-)
MLSLSLSTNDQIDESQNNSNYACFKWCKNTDNYHAKLLFIGWILFIFISLPLVVFYVAFIGYYEDSPSILLAYFVGAIISILISIYTIFCFRLLQEIYKTNIKFRSTISKLLRIRSKVKRQTGHLLAQVLKLKQEKEYVDGPNVRLRAKLKLFAIWANKIMRDGTSYYPHINDDENIDLIDANGLYKIQEKLMSTIKRTEMRMMKNEKSILINAYSSALIRYDVNQLRVKQFASMMTTWPVRYQTEFVKSGKSFRDFNNGYELEFVNYDIFNAFVNKSVIQQVTNGVELPGLCDENY